MPPADAAVVRSFAAFLGEVENGVLHADLTEALADLVAALNDHRQQRGGKPKGRIAVTFDFKLDGDVVEVGGEIKLTKPKTERGRSIFWTTPENRLSKLNPRQQDLFVRPVDDAAPTVRKAE